MVAEREPAHNSYGHAGVDDAGVAPPTHEPAAPDRLTRSNPSDSTSPASRRYASSARLGRESKPEQQACSPDQNPLPSPAAIQAG